MKPSPTPIPTGWESFPLLAHTIGQREKRRPWLGRVITVWASPLVSIAPGHSMTRVEERVLPQCWN